MTMNELKPCSVCESEIPRIRRHCNQYGDVWWGLQCQECGFEVVSKNFDVPMDAIDAWNRVP